jgi:hypothetical protein
MLLIGPQPLLVMLNTSTQPPQVILAGKIPITTIHTGDGSVASMSHIIDQSPASASHVGDVQPTTTSHVGGFDVV